MTLPQDWDRWKASVDLGRYDDRWARMAEAGENPHGEADLVASFRPRSVLDGGCGTGRVAIELGRRGITVLGVDPDPDMIAAARAKAPGLRWILSGLEELALDDRFDVIVLAGNVIPYAEAAARPEVVASCARHLAPGGRLVAGFSLRPGWPTLADYDAWCTGLAPETRLATWAGDPYEGGDYAVSVHRAP
ncbi:class I SAM-dependent methyltransferase [Pseudonocardia ailaonensis]|uniref:Class I SAM-dependent methyltransferase n=1 Tax=Pseudonocardia ailaonensis TaxID=367279 RepID=A0ABN2NB34_9PSEU